MNDRSLGFFRYSIALGMVASALFSGCRAPPAADGGEEPPAPAGAAEVEGSLDPAAIDWIRSQPEVIVLARASVFQGVPREGPLPPEVAAFRMVLGYERAPEVFRDLLERASLPGRLYALCGIWLADPSDFARAAAPYLSSGRPVRASPGGSAIEVLPAGDLVRSSRARAVRLDDPLDSLEKWVRRRGLPEELEPVIDIAGGGIPMELREAAPEDPPGAGAGPVAELLVDLASGEDRVRAAAARRLGELGPGGLDGQALEAGALLGGLLEDPAPATRREAREALLALGAWAVEALPALAAAGGAGEEPPGGPEGEYRAALLGAIGPAAAPLLADLLGSPDPAVRAAAAAALAEGGEAPEDAVETLRVLADLDPERAVRVRATVALWKTAGSSRQALKALLAEYSGEHEALLDPVERLDLLIDLATGSPEALEAAIAAAGDPSAPARIEAIEALGAIGEKGIAALPVLRVAAGDEDPGIAVAAAEAIRGISNDPDEAVRLWTEILGSLDRDERLGALDALARIGPPAATSVREVARGLKDIDPWVREAAADALRTMGRGARPALAAVRQAVRDPHPAVAWAAREALPAIEGRPAGPETPPRDGR